MNRHALSLDSLAVESFATGAAGDTLAGFDAAAPTRNCDTRQTACTVPPME